MDPGTWGYVFRPLGLQVSTASWAQHLQVSLGHAAAALCKPAEPANTQLGSTCLVWHHPAAVAAIMRSSRRL